MRNYEAIHSWTRLPIRRFFTYDGAMRWWRKQTVRGLIEIRYRRSFK